jgi:hypothetical protein
MLCDRDPLCPLLLQYILDAVRIATSQQRDPQAELKPAAFAFRRLGFGRLGLHGRIIPRRGRRASGRSSAGSNMIEEVRPLPSNDLAILTMDAHFWPYLIHKVPAKWNRFDRDFIQFMQTAYMEGYRPRTWDFRDAEAESSSRMIYLCYRGSHGWEPFMNESNRPVRLGPHYGLPLGMNACVCVCPPFSAAAQFALQWLRGRSLESLLDDFEFFGGCPSTIKLRAHVPSEVPAT